MGLPAPPPRLRLGQHFLIDHNIVRKIVAAAALDRDDTVLEIGPGRGILTAALCQAAKRVIAVELDTRLIEFLQETLSCPNLELHHADALAFDYACLPSGTVVVANLPYYVSTPLLFTLLERRDRLARMVLMLQTEVARRLVATPGTEDYGIVSVLCRYWTDPTIAFHVSPHCFRPRPEVDSSVVRLILRPHPVVTVPDEREFVRLVRASFAHRRKTLLNSLRQEAFDVDVVRDALEQAGITPTRRAETLTLEEFAALARALAER